MNQEEANKKNIEEIEVVMQEEQDQQEVAEEQENPEERCQTEVMIWKDQCHRISAEFENFKKRTERDQVRWGVVAKESILKDLLSTVDDFDRALSQIDDASKEGVEMMYQALLKVLEKNNVKKCTEYSEFNPEIHEAVMQVESADHAAGEIVDVYQHCFMINDRVLRPAKVSVAK